MQVNHNKDRRMGQDVRLHDREIEITKIFTFDACHFLYNYEGKCANLHGHTYKLEVTVKGPLDERGLVMDFGDLKQIVQKEVLEPLDHQILNDQMEEFSTTVENMVVWIWRRLAPEIAKTPGLRLWKLRLWETPAAYATLRASDMGE